MKVKTYNAEGKEAGTMELPEKIFGVELNPDLVHQVMVSQQGNRRQVSAHTKTRGEVSGGGRKPWPQKHTGNARHGSIRSPIWTGGGVSHGPRADRNYTKKINKKMSKKALFMVLSEKVRNDMLFMLEDMQLEGAKTKALGMLLRKLPCENKNTLIALPEMNQAVIRAGNNIPSARTIQARELNVLDLLNAKYLVMPKESIEVIEKTFVT
ncbi:MAG TPA: 50S ribosomal protein L4 [Candidatus Paceibacterota bacterium]|nr:50S ribosomal protein L4 [Candidatus Paceibacterota bacterium]